MAWAGCSGLADFQRELHDSGSARTESCLAWVCASGEKACASELRKVRRCSLCRAVIRPCSLPWEEEMEQS